MYKYSESNMCGVPVVAYIIVGCFGFALFVLGLAFGVRRIRQWQRAVVAQTSELQMLLLSRENEGIRLTGDVLILRLHLRLHSACQACQMLCCDPVACVVVYARAGVSGVIRAMLTPGTVLCEK